MKPVLLLIFTFGIFMEANSQIKLGQTAPDLSLPDMNGNQVGLSHLRGKVILIDFWASWCAPCRRNNPNLVRLYKKYHELGLEIYGISIDNNGEHWKEAVQQDKMDWIQVNDDKGWDASSVNLYGINAIPASFLVDKQRIVRQIDLSARHLEMEIKSLLKK
ncbi:MAG: peroxiredoxin family protein [Chitinophagales bacterium]